jgi:hypothetical protein
MESIGGVLFVIIIFITLFHSARRISKIRSKIKAGANKECDAEIELTNDELEIRLGEADLMYEELEQTYWAHTSALIGIASYFYWHNGYLSLGASVLLALLGDKYLSIKPFKSGIPDR